MLIRLRSEQNRYIAYDENPTGEYSSNLRAERPADISDKFFVEVRISVSGNRVKIINKTSMKQIYSSGVFGNARADC